MTDKKVQPKRSRGFMFVQKIQFLKFLPMKDVNLINDLIEKSTIKINDSLKKGTIKINDSLKKDIDDSLKHILENSGASEWAFILHNRDINEDGDLKDPHYHVFLYFRNAKSVHRVANLFNDEPERVEVWKYNKNNAYSYLIHETSEARQEKKHHYADNDVEASFDFLKKMAIIRANVKAKKFKISDSEAAKFIQLYADDNNDMSREDLSDTLGTYYMAKYRNLISNVDQELALKKHQDFLKEFKGQRCWIIWLYGQAGVGKTSTIRKVLEQEYEGNFCILGSSRDYFQEYNGENYIVINDLRPNEINYGDLLKLFDPYEHDKQAPARYHDKFLNAKQIYITTPYSPYDFWEETYVANRKIDTYDQLSRRITVFEMTNENAFNMYRTLIIFNDNLKKEINSENRNTTQ